MADEVSDVNIEKGVHLSVVVEFCVQNVIVVCLKNKGKEFKGVLLESDGGFFPFSFPFLKSSFPSVKSPQKAELLCPPKNDSSGQPDPANKNGSQTPEAPATTQRFSYNHDPFLVNPTPIPELTVVEMKPIAPRTKTIRDIRLRPRQTLCSNCKSAIHEGRKTRGNSSHSTTDQSKNPLTTSTPDSRLRPRANGAAPQITPLKPRPGKRKSETQTPMVLLEDIKHKSTRFSATKDQKRSGNTGAAENEPTPTNKSSFESSVESLTNTTNRIRASRKSLLLEANINHEVNVQSNSPTMGGDHSDASTFKPGKKNKQPNSDHSSKPSPAIKISIKGGAVLKIPPRLPDYGSPLSGNVSEADKAHPDIPNNSQLHKKAKKSAKRAKDRHRSDSTAGFSILPNGDQPSNRSFKKHKKKHRHRHQSPVPGEEGKTSSHLFNESHTHTKEQEDIKLFRPQSNNFDIFSRETNNRDAMSQRLNNVISLKEEISDGDAFTSEPKYSTAYGREGEVKEVTALRNSNNETNNMDALRFRRELNSVNSSFSGDSNKVNTFSRNMDNANTSRGANSSIIYRQNLKFETCSEERLNNVLCREETDSMNTSSQMSHLSSTSTHLENNNILFKDQDTICNQVSSTEGYLQPFGPSGNIRQAISPMQQKQIRVGDCFIDVVDISDSDSENELQRNDISPIDPPNLFNSSLTTDDLPGSRPRLLYTWKQDQGLERVESQTPLPPPPPPPPLVPASIPSQIDDQSPRYLVKTSPSVLPSITNSPHRRKNASPGRVVNASPSVQFSTGSPLIKDYPLRNRTGSLSNQSTDLLMIAERGGIVSVSEDSQSHSSGLESRFSDISGESDEDQLENIFEPCGGESVSQDEDDDKDLSKPLMLKIQTQNVPECVMEGGRRIVVGDIVWGKIQGFPWWPGKVTSITVTRRDNNVVISQLANVAWFGSNTMSHVHCRDLFPFLEDFKLRYNKKKKGPYKMAIKQATQAAHKSKMSNGVSHEGILSFTD